MLLDVLERTAGVADLHGLRAGRPADHEFPRPRRRPAAGRSRLRNDARLAGRRSATSAAWPICRQRARDYLDRLSALVGRPGGSRFRGARPAANDFCLTMSTMPDAAKRDEAADRVCRPSVPRREDAAPHRHHHGRQRPLGPPRRACRGSRAIAAASRASAASPRSVPGWASSSSRSTAFPARTGSGRPRNSISSCSCSQQYMVERAVADHGAEHPRRGHRPPRGPARGRPARNRRRPWP